MNKEVSKKVAGFLVFVTLFCMLEFLSAPQVMAAPTFDISVEIPLSPRQLQQGTTVRINVSVTGGEPNTIYKANVTARNAADQIHWALASLSNTTTSGIGSAVVIYPTNFTAGANMNYTGTYKALFNETIAEEEFFVGLTDKTTYRRTEEVLVQAAGYKSSEMVKADLRTGESSVAGFPKNLTASTAGLVTMSWEVPANATRGTYRIALTNTTSSGTAKTPSDAQDFEVAGFICLVQAKNLADETVEGALIESYNASASTSALTKGSTNSTGWTRFNLDGGNYTFKAFVKNAEVSVLSNLTIAADTELLLSLRLFNFAATVKTEAGDGVPLVDIALKYNYTTRDSTVATGMSTAKTNITGTVSIRNLLTNTTYRVEAQRYGMLFNTTTLAIEPLPASGFVDLSLTLPTYTLSVHAKNAKDSNATGVSLRVFEWASGVTVPLDSTETDSNGDASFSLPFGKYILRAYKDEDLLSETVVDLDEPLAFAFNLRTLDVDVTVFVLDYFGQPIANAEVKIERKVGESYVLASLAQFTNSGGSVTFLSIVGGESRLWVYVAGKLVGVQTQFLGSGSNEVTFRASEYVALLGYPVAAGTFALVCFFTVVLVIAVLAVTRKRILTVFRRRTKR